MKKYTATFILLFFTQLNSISLAEKTTPTLSTEITKIDRTLYKNAKISQTPEGIVIDLWLQRERDGYNADALKVCFKSTTCEEDDWALIEKDGEKYFNTPSYSDAKSFTKNEVQLNTAFNLCQTRSSDGKISMSGQCLTIVGQKKDKKFIYNTYLGKALKCRPDSKCWKKSMERRINFMTKSLDALDTTLPNK